MSHISIITIVGRPPEAVDQTNRAAPQRAPRPPPAAPARPARLNHGRVGFGPQSSVSVGFGQQSSVSVSFARASCRSPGPDDARSRPGSAGRCSWGDACGLSRARVAGRRCSGRPPAPACWGPSCGWAGGGWVDSSARFRALVRRGRASGRRRRPDRRARAARHAPEVD